MELSPPGTLEASLTSFIVDRTGWSNIDVKGRKRPLQTFTTNESDGEDVSLGKIREKSVKQREQLGKTYIVLISLSCQKDRIAQEFQVLQVAAHQFVFSFYY